MIIRRLWRRFQRWRWRRQATVIEGDRWAHRNEVFENVWIKGTLHIAVPNVVIRHAEIGALQIHLDTPIDTGPTV